MSYAKRFIAEGMEVPEAKRVRISGDTPDVVPETPQETEQTTYYKRSQIRDMSYAEKKKISSKNWNVQVSLCKVESPEGLLDTRINVLKTRLGQIPEKNGFVYAGDVCINPVRATYNTFVALAFDVPVTYGWIMRTFGVWDMRKAQETGYNVEAFPGFPYFGILAPANDTGNVRTLHRDGPIFTRGEPRSCYTPIKYFLKGL